MKFNLKTIKLKIRAYNTRRGTLEDISKEFEGFENELRESIDYWLNKSKQTGRFLIIDQIKEILGE